MARRKNSRKLYVRKKGSTETAARRGALVFGMLLLVVLLVGALCFLFLGARDFFFAGNPLFTVKKVVMLSDGQLSSARLKENAKVKPGDNLFGVDFDELRDNLSFPQVESVEIRRILPDTLFVRVTERVALAQVKWKWMATPYLVDRNGVAMAGKSETLPIIEGEKIEQPRPGEVIANEGIQFVIKILAERDQLLAEYDEKLSEYQPNSDQYKIYLPTRNLIADMIQFKRFNLRYPDYIIATLSNGTTVHFPRHSARARLIGLIGLLEKTRDEGRTPLTVDLVPDGVNVPVTY